MIYKVKDCKYCGQEVLVDKDYIGLYAWHPKCFDANNPRIDPNTGKENFFEMCEVHNHMFNANTSCEFCEEK